jgi:Uri superfamily endonuclease
MLELPALPGAYVLELYLPQEATIVVGRLGEARFPAGAMLYLGSACGPGGLKGRLNRHLQPNKAGSLHWHIDYLRRVARVRAIAYLVQPESPPAEPLECLWSQALVRLPGSSVPLPGFGASDCRLGCPAHLVAFPGVGRAGTPLLQRSAWLEALERAAGAPLVISPSPA